MVAMFGTADTGDGELPLPLGLAVAYGLYYVLLGGLRGQTIGKMVTGIIVVGERTGEAPGAGAALVRTVLGVTDGLFSYLLGFVVLACRRRKRLGDMAARTLVVRG